MSNTTNTPVVKFETGKSYITPIGEIVMKINIVRRTAKQVTFTVNDEVLETTKGVQFSNGVEFMLPEGKYTGAPRCRANRLFVEAVGIAKKHKNTLSVVPRDKVDVELPEDVVFKASLKLFFLGEQELAYELYCTALREGEVYSNDRFLELMDGYVSLLEREASKVFFED